MDTNGSEEGAAFIFMAGSFPLKIGAVSWYPSAKQQCSTSRQIDFFTYQ